MNLKPEEREIGKDNFSDAVTAANTEGKLDRPVKAEGYSQLTEASRRDFLKAVVATGAVAGVSTGAMYFGYNKVKNPLRVGVIGTGDEGNVLMGAINPDYVQVVAIADIRPYNIHRAFHGDWATEDVAKIRTGLMAKYGWKTEDEARKHVKVYSEDYNELLKDKDVEAVIIALPLHLHHEATMEAMKAGKHVLVEKLMAQNIAQCKEMAKASKELDKVLAVGHQRHYSVLYDNAVHLLKWGLLGELHHIRAQWHRGNKPGGDSWSPPMPPQGSEKKEQNKIYKQWVKLQQALKEKSADPKGMALLEKQVMQWEKWLEDSDVKAKEYGYKDEVFQGGYNRSALEELVRWRLFDRTGGGLMAELGSHQLDAASIFCSALRRDGKKAHPLTVHAVGGRHLFPNDRDAEDHVYCMFEFPGPGYEPGFDVGYKDDATGVPDPKKGVPSYEQDPNKKIVVTYSTINGNGFGGYGEVVMGTKGTLIIEREVETMLFKDADTSTRVGVRSEKGGVAVLDTQHSGPQKAAAKAGAAEGPPSKGYTEEIEHWAWCIQNRDPENKPRCHPAVAMGDAIIALTTKLAIRKQNKGGPGYVKFKEEWFDVDNPATPEEDEKV